jgi:hypothetical protein
MSALFFELSAGLDEIQSISYRKRSTVMTAPYKKQSEVEWESHFMTDNGKIKWIYTREKDDSPITVMQVRLEKGVTSRAKARCSLTASASFRPKPE